MRALVVAPNWIGDAVMAQPLLSLLRGQQADIRIDVLCPPHLAAVFRAMPEVDAVIESPNVHGRLDLRGRWRMARELRARKYRRAIILPNSAKSALIPWLAGIPERIGYLGEARRVLLNRIRHHPQPVDRDHPGAAAVRPPMVEQFARLALEPGEALPGPVPNPRLRSDPSVRQATLARLGLPMDGTLFALCPGAEYGPAKRWPVKHFARLATELAARWPGARIVLLGGPKEQALGDEIESLAGVALSNLCGHTTLEQAMAVLAACTAAVSNDSGLMHLAAAFDRPLVAVFGSSDPRHTPPRSARARIEWLRLDCSPCFERECPLGHLDCLNGIEPQRVLGSLEAALSPN